MSAVYNALDFIFIPEMYNKELWIRGKKLLYWVQKWFSFLEPAVASKSSSSVSTFCSLLLCNVSVLGPGLEFTSY